MKRILIAEDDPDTAGALTLNLEDRLRPDLLILDVSLPGLKGVDVFDLIRGTAMWGRCRSRSPVG